MKKDKIPIRSASVSVIILTYGNYSGLKKTIESILQQTYPIQTFILSDDGSGLPFPDDILNELQTNQARFEKLIIRQNNRNLGTVAHLNTAAALCNSEYIKFLACGDAFFNSNSLHNLINFAQKEHTLAVTSNAMVTSSDFSHSYYPFPGSRRGKKLKGTSFNTFNILARKNIISAAGTLLHCDFFSVFGGFDTQYSLLEDWPAWLKLTREGSRIPFLNQVTCYYSLGGISSKDGNAFDSLKLRQDMLRCYEKEILPYMSELNFCTRRTISFYYDCLRGAEKRVLWKHHFLLELMDYLKRWLKRIILRKTDS